ncbi:MAG TPA: 5'/3'-nucleotidase SurE [Acidimicrobiales bacterium]|nr:5'/3'-nucleotidase SurE [Acidimicrobiales bacterium]
MTNDDGAASEGIAVLARAARAQGLEVLVAAPSWDASGSSAAVTAVESDEEPVCRQVRRPGLDTPALAVEAAPAFIVRAALGGKYGPAPDVVLSGVNHGLNTGAAIIHSGTVGAALTAGIGGVPAAAFSMDVAAARTGEPVHWDTAAFVARSVISWLIEAEGTLVLNVNVPNVPGEALRGLRRGGLAPIGTVRTTVTEEGTGERLAAAAVRGRPAPEGSDAALVVSGAASYTPIRPVTEDRDAQIT